MFGLIRVKSHKRLLAEAEADCNRRVKNLVASQERQVNMLMRYQRTRFNFCANCGQDPILKGR